ncbi:MAG: hypothetical protein JWQ71_3726 [Pedosphaera sp.]|nr:hypothetical protein [Pedosphaera sp.]
MMFGSGVTVVRSDLGAECRRQFREITAAGPPWFGHVAALAIYIQVPDLDQAAPVAPSVSSSKMALSISDHLTKTG